MTQLLFVLLCGDGMKKHTTLDVCSSCFGVNIASHFLCLNLKVLASRTLDFKSIVVTLFLY